MSARLDPVTVGILWDRLIAIADEATTTLHRAAFSTAVRESNDFAITILDGRGEGTLAAAQSGLPSFISTQAVTLGHALKLFPLETLQPGDVIITNDPWLATGQAMDVTMLAPIFLGERLVAFAGSVAHSPDLGGARQWARASDVYEEAIALPLLKLYRAGVPSDDIFALLRANCREPARTLGDIDAMLAAMQILSDRLLELMEEAALTDLDELADVIYGLSEKIMREAIAAVPDGSYSARVLLDDRLPDPVTGAVGGDLGQLAIEATITIAGDGLVVDFAGTSVARRNSTNATAVFTASYAKYAVRYVLVPLLPHNAGFLRPVTIVVPDGCALGVRRPAATANRHIIGQQACDAIFGALVQAVPDRVMAPGGSTPNWLLVMAGSGRDGHPYSRILPLAGGLGAFPAKDGEIAFFPANLLSTPMEMVESEQELVVVEKSVIPDSAGAGRFRGAPGQRVVLRAQARTLFTMLTGKVDHPAQGLLGGLPGRAGVLLLNGEPIGPGDGVLEPGDVLWIETPGGAGLHDPRERPVAAVLRDVRHGLVSVEQARAAYRVALVAGTLEVDDAATARLRAGAQS